MHKKNSAVLIVATIMFFSISAFAFHDSIATISPETVQPSTNYTFTANVQNLGPDPVTEFRTYINNEFSDFICDPKEGWNGPFVIPIGNDFFCQYTVISEEFQIEAGENTDFTFSATTPQTQSCRQIHLETRDPEQYYEPFFIDICVDTTPPQTTKSYGEPFYSDGEREWISSDTEIGMEAVDPEPHPSGVSNTFYRETQVSDYFCDNPVDFCNPLPPCEGDSSGDCSDEEFSVYSEPFTLEQSCHIIEFYSEDNVGNVEQLNYQCAFVDDTAPSIEKELSDPAVPCEEGQACDYFITQETEITLSCSDNDPHPVNNNTIFWQYRVDEGTGFGDWVGPFEEQESEVSFSFPENSIHELEYWCADALGNESGHFTEIDFVDSEPPILSKEVIGEHQFGDCPPDEPGDECFVDDGVEIHLTAQDTPANHAVEEFVCEWTVEWEGEIIDSGEFDDESDPVVITFNEDSEHLLTIVCADLLGNELTDIETFLVDLLAPETETVFDGTEFSCMNWCEMECGGDQQCIDACIEDTCQGNPLVPTWISAQTNVQFDAVDEKSGVFETLYRVTAVPDEFCESQQACVQLPACDPDPQVPCSDEEFSVYTDPFTLEGSCHIIESYSVDNLWNTEETKTKCVFVDAQAPSVEKTVGEPNFPCEEGQECDYFITQETPIYLACEDNDPHPSGHETIFWQYSLDGGEILGPFEYEDAIFFQEDSVHELEYWCVDAVGNESEHFSEIDKVDTEAPEIIKTVEGPQVGECPPEPDSGEECFINDETTIAVATIDGGPICHVDHVTCEWGYYWNDEWFGFFPYEGPISFNEDSEHELVINCEDALGNSVEESETFNVDLLSPVTSKEYEGPYFSCLDWCELDCTDQGEGCYEDCVINTCNYNGEELFPEWISSGTSVLLSAIDEKTGVDKTFWKVTQVDDAYCETPQMNCVPSDGENFNEYNEPITGIEESCHLIEYFSEDMLGNTELVNWQCAFVDNTSPIGVKTVGEPSTQCTENDPDCISPWNPEIIADYKVTTVTPITLECTDLEPHPVGHSTVYWRWNLDNGPWSEWESDEGPVVIRFSEESFHGLEFYCQDALGNIGEPDLEYFKVSGTAFSVPLHFKWNLVSVPFVLDNDDPQEVFAGLEEEVESVWAYDGQTEEWQVFRPSSPQTSNLDSIIPGWGYWVWSNEDANLLVGGALFGPNTLPPSRDLVEGWNLIGYYGVDWQDYSQEPPGTPDDPVLCLADEPFFGSKTYCALNSLVNTNSGLPDWDSLWGYTNCGSDDSFWYGLNLCNEQHKPTRLYAGKGYWVLLNEDQIYAPATTCIGEEDWVCIQP